MKNPTLTLTLLLLLAGIGLSGWTLSSRAERLAEIRKYSHYMSELDEMDARTAAIESKIELFEKLPAKKATPLSTLLQSSPLNGAATVEEGETSQYGGTWSVARSRLIVQSGSWAGLVAFLQQAESSRPPWRMTTLTFTPAANGTVNAAVDFETLTAE